jgi:hypothetical protein
MPTGETSGLFVVDLDNKPTVNGIENLARLAALHGELPDGPVVVTPSGGRHLYFRAPAGGGPTTAGVAGPGIDTRGHGGMVVLAPSLHKTGRRYRWDRRLSLYLPDRMPAVPPWFLELLRPRTATAKVTTGIDTARAWAVPEDEASATLIELLDSAYVRWMVENAEDVSREVWRALVTNLYAACAGHLELLELAHDAWHTVSACDGVRYRHGHAERAWVDAANSPPISFDHASLHGAPEDVCSPTEKNLVLQARSAAMSARRPAAFVNAALKYLVENPGALAVEAAARRTTTRDLLIDEGFLEDTAGYVRGAARHDDADEKGDQASPA